MQINSELLKLAAGILREFSNDGPKTLAMVIMAPAVLRSMQFVPQGEMPSVERLSAVLRDAAAALEKASKSPQGH